MKVSVGVESMLLPAVGYSEIIRGAGRHVGDVDRQLGGNGGERYSQRLVFYTMVAHL